MDIFITNLDSKTSREQLKESLTPVLLKFDTHVFDVHKSISKTFATLTIADLPVAQDILAKASSNPNFFISPSRRPAKFQVSRKPVDEFHLKTLRREGKKDRASIEAWQESAKRAPGAQANIRSTTLELSTIKCGQWETSNTKNMFRSYFELQASGHLREEGRSLVLDIKNTTGEAYSLMIDTSTIISITVGNEITSTTLTVTSYVAPGIFDHQTSPKTRISNLPGQDLRIAGGCLTYSLTFARRYPALQQQIRTMTSHQIPITAIESKQRLLRSPGDFIGELAYLNTEMDRYKCSFAWKFQLHALWANSILSPTEVSQLLPAMRDIRSQSGEPTLLDALQRLATRMSPMDDGARTRERGLSAITESLANTSLLFEDDYSTTTRNEMHIHRVTVTPAGNYLSGPELTPTNRILRQYPGHADCFLRVNFSDENGDRIQFDRGCSNEKIFRERFLGVLQKGLNIAGEHFDFLGFSHSSLRAQTCWFMRPFLHEGSLLFAKALIAKLGDFSEIRCPAKCAARIGQAFSDTSVAITIDPDIVQYCGDVRAGQYLFTDGCGTISAQTWRLLKGSASKANQPTSYQIRYKGAKGMLTLDTALEGHRIRLRSSMVKFTGSPSDELEICGTNARPLPFYLNRQIIKILEDLMVEQPIFLKLQQQAIQRLALSATSRTAAIDFVVRELSDSSSGLPYLLKNLKHLGVDVTEDDFLRDILGALLQVKLREIKYRSRIFVPDAYTLYGISDETSWLKEGQVFVTWFDQERDRDVCLNGRVAVTRSPALHPGDIQLADAVAPPKDSSLWNLRNCVVFSQQGSRDLPSMLSGGDLDGDLYNVIFDEDLMPKYSTIPSTYTPALPLDIQRAVNTDDMTSFFVDFMQNDQLARIANLHQVMADQEDKGTFSPVCLKLAGLHSTAVDFSKSSIKVDMMEIPKSPIWRPDFMAPSASVKVEKGIKRVKEEESNTSSKHRFRYYESDHVLGELYRAVDEDIFFQDLEDDASSLFSKDVNNNVLSEILDWVCTRVSKASIGEYLAVAREVRDFYEDNMIDIMVGFAGRRTEQLTEKEVFIGTILGHSGAANKRQREQSDEMKTRFNYDLRGIKNWMEEQTVDDDSGYGFFQPCCGVLAGRCQGREHVRP